MAKKGLGKGLDSLIPSVREVDFVIDNEAQTAHSRPILISDIKPNPNQPRKIFDTTAMEELKASIKSHGLMQPIVVVRHGAGFHIVAGERRWRALKELGHDTIPAIVRTLDEQQRVEAALIENLQREDLSPLEIAATLAKLVDQFSLRHEDLAKRIGKASSTVANTIRLLNLPGQAKKALEQGKISEGHARTILALEGNSQKQQALLDYIMKNGWSVRQAEKFAMASKHDTTKKGLKNVASTNAETTQLTKKLGVRTPVIIHNMSRGKGRIIIEFNDKTEYEEITKRLLA